MSSTRAYVPLLATCLALGCSNASSATETDAGGHAKPTDATATDGKRTDAKTTHLDSSSTKTGPDGDAGACTSPSFSGSPLGVRCNALVDSEGRTVLLHGLNARVASVFDDTFTDGRLPLMTLPSFTAEDATRIRALGFNALRLPVNWSGIEPTEDGGIVASYLDGVAAVTSMCGAAGVLVLIDLHQDAYSKEIGQDGAPLWAISPPPTQLLGGPLTDLGSRFSSVQVQDAYSTFFAGPDAGAYLRTRYAAMAEKLATRFANDPAVLGFELYNEPIAGEPQLVAFDQQMIPAVRAAAPTKLVLFEPNAVRNEINMAPLGDGSLGAGTAYAPHVYTLAFTDPDETGVTEATYSASNVNALSEARSWEAPLVITEYGYPPGSPNFANWAMWQGDLEDEVRASSFFWLWKEYGTGSWGFYDFDDAGTGTERGAVVAAMTRARLEAAAGEIVSVAYDAASLVLTVVLNGSDAVTAPNVVSIGAGAVVPAGEWKATCDGVNVRTGGGDPLEIVCGGAGGHTLVVRGQ
jgi:endoglycosylceramidase